MTATRRYVAIMLVLTAGPLAMLGAWLYTVDPYWLFHDRPPWYEPYGGHNRALDIRNRFAKSLQVIRFQPRLIVFGSSRVYRGIPTGRTPLLPRRSFNYGISSMTVRELDYFVQNALNWSRPGYALIGLDFFMFDHHKPDVAGFDPLVAQRKFLFKGLGTALFTVTAFKDARKAMTGDRAGDGFWNRSGWKRTTPRSAEEVERVLKGFYNSRIVVTDTEYDYLRDTLARLRSARVETRLFISPSNTGLVSRLEESGQFDGFTAWRSTVASIAEQAGAGFYDFFLDNPFFNSYPAAGSNGDWLDASHYSATTGEWIIRQIYGGRWSGERQTAVSFSAEM